MICAYITAAVSRYGLVHASNVSTEIDRVEYVSRRIAIKTDDPVSRQHAIATIAIHETDEMISCLLCLGINRDGPTYVSHTGVHVHFDYGTIDNRRKRAVD
jgi:hypothetical protein